MPVKIEGAKKPAAKSLDTLLADAKGEAPNDAAVEALYAAAEPKLMDLPGTDADDEAPAEVAQPTDAELVDELAELMAWEAEQKKDARLVRLKELKEHFALKADADFGPDDVAQFHGTAHLYQLGKQSTVRAINPDYGKAKIIEMIGADTFLELAQIKLSDVDAYLTPPQKKQVLDESRGGRTGKMLDK